jgi:hypothetical protein
MQPTGDTTATTTGGNPALEELSTTTDPANRTFRRLRMGGLSTTEAGNLTARVKGLRAVPGGWKVEEIERLLFVRELVRQGRITS